MAAAKEVKETTPVEETTPQVEEKKEEVAEAKKPGFFEKMANAKIVITPKKVGMTILGAAAGVGLFLLGAKSERDKASDGSDIVSDTKDESTAE